MNTARQGNKAYFLILVMYLAFISLGLPDGLLGIAWPFMSARYSVSLDSLGVLLMCFTAGYLSTSSTSGKILKLIHLSTLLMISCLLTGTSLLVFAFSEYWFGAIVAAFCLGAGGGAIDSAINTFAASHYSASVLNWLHAFYGIGATAGPLLITFLLAVNFQWYNGYIIVALIQIALAALFLFSRKYWRVASHEEKEDSGAEYWQTLKLPVVWVNMLLFFLYTGFEQGFGQWVFTILTKSRGMIDEEAGLWASAYWGSLTVGRILSGIILVKVSVNQTLKLALSGIVAGAFMVMLDINNWLTLAGIMTIGLANAPVFPSLISVTPQRVGKEHAATAIGAQISTAMLGASLLPAFAGWLSRGLGLEMIPKVFAIAAIVLMLLYLVSTRKAKSKELS